MSVPTPTRSPRSPTSNTRPQAPEQAEHYIHLIVDGAQRGVNVRCSDTEEGVRPRCAETLLASGVILAPSRAELLFGFDLTRHRSYRFIEDRDIWWVPEGTVAIDTLLDGCRSELERAPLPARLCLNLYSPSARVCVKGTWHPMTLLSKRRVDAIRKFRRRRELLEQHMGEQALGSTICAMADDWLAIQEMVAELLQTEGLTERQRAVLLRAVAEEFGFAFEMPRKYHGVAKSTLRKDLEKLRDLLEPVTEKLLGRSYRRPRRKKGKK